MNINWAHVHLMINHFPVLGVPGAILLLSYGLLRKSDEIKTLSFGVIVLVALLTIPVYLTGGEAAKAVKDLPGVTEAFVGRHEELAGLALVLIEVLGVMALAGLFLLRRSGSIPRWLVLLVLAASLVTAAVTGFTANLGGEIRHTEIRGKG